MDVEALKKVATQFILQPPKLGLAPPVVDQKLMAMLLPYPSVRGTVMRLANRYYLAGCPLDLCETAACRDIFLATKNQKNSNAT